MNEKMVNDTREMLVTVVVPVFNVKKYVDECVSSIRGQTHSALEIILVDDGSTDGSGEVCDALTGEDKRIRVIHQDNMGLSAARNAGIDHANGEYICFIDSDDSIDKTFVEQLLFMCVEYRSEVSVCNYFYVTENEKFLSPQSCEEIKVYSGEDAVRQCCQYPNDGIFNIAWNKLYKKELFCDIRYPDGKIHEDEFTTYKILAGCERVAVTDRCLYYYLQRSNSIMGERFQPKRLDKLEAMKERLLFLNDDTYKNEYVRTLFHTYGFIQSYDKRLKEAGTSDKATEKLLTESEKELREDILSLKDVDTLRKIRAIYGNLPEKEQIYYKNLFGNSLSSCKSEDFLFPFQMIPVGSRIVIYGAGGVGKAYYRQIISTSYAQVCAWVDAFWVLPKNSGYPVTSIGQGLETEYDYIVIALRNRVEANKVRCNLLDWGVSGEKIVWANPLVPGIADACEINVKRTERKEKGNKRIYLLNTPDYGNLGDHAIAIAERKYLEDFFSDYEIIEISGKKWDKLENALKLQIEDTDIMAFTGGGYMGNLWEIENCRVNEIIRDFPNNKKIFLPQSLYYDKKGWGSKYDSIDSNTLFIHRELFSLNTAELLEGYKAGENEVGLDIVLYLHPEQMHCRREGILVCVRRDKEKKADDGILKEVVNFADDKNILLSYTDTVLNNWNQYSNRYEELEKILQLFLSARIVVTDRLHGMIFSAITGTPCLAFDNLTGKVGGVYEMIKGLPYIRICKEDKGIREELVHLYDMKDTEYPPNFLKEKFSEMALCMHNWMETAI